MDLSALMTETTDGLIDLAMLIGRLFIGICFMVHAFGKLGLVGTGNMAGFIEWLESEGLPFAKQQAYLVMSSELLGGAALALGFMMRPAALLLAGTMVGAAVIGHKGAGYLITNEPEGAEYTINLAAICVVFALIGPRAYSLDALIF